MKAHILNRARARSLTTVVPSLSSQDYAPDLARIAANVLYKSPIPTKSGHSIYILNAAALPDTEEVDYDMLLPYLVSRLPGEDDLVSGTEYEVVFFAGSGAESTTASKKSRPGWGWLIQAYHLLSRAMRKRIKKLYIVHEKTWVRVLAEMFYTVVSPKFRKKIVYASSLSALALQIPIQSLLIPLSAYLQDRKISDDIFEPYCTGRRAFSAAQPLPIDYKGKTRFPRVLRETTSFILMPENILSEGLFRISPPAKVRSILKESYDRGQKFIIWKDRSGTLPLPPYSEAEDTTTILEEADFSETYSVHLAAALIKLWYSELRTPILPSSSYNDFMRNFSTIAPTKDSVFELIAPKAEWSCLPFVSRIILTRHLFPMLHEVAKHQNENKMTAENLAVCFAPSLICGVDQMEDVKISNSLRPILVLAINSWTELRKRLGVDEGDFWKELETPTDMNDYEDPLYEDTITGTSSITQVDSTMQATGITMKDEVHSTQESLEFRARSMTNEENLHHPQPPLPLTPPPPPPPLPPRSEPPLAVSPPHTQSPEAAIGSKGSENEGFTLRKSESVYRKPLPGSQAVHHTQVPVSLEERQNMENQSPVDDSIQTTIPGPSDQANDSENSRPGERSGVVKRKPVGQGNNSS